MSEQHKNEKEVTWKLEDAQFIWDEYKYRHAHIWKLIFQITTAVIAVSIVPYISNETIVKTLQLFIVALPVLGAGIVIFGWSRLAKEMYAMGELKKRHREFQKLNYGIDYYPKKKNSFLNKNSSKRKSSFSLHVEIYLGSLLALCILNVFIIIFVWLPEISKANTVLK